MGDGQKLLLSIHDVSPRFESAIDQLADQLAAHAGWPGFALLVVPDHWGEAPLRAGTPFAAKLRRFREAGAEIFVHGWFHRDTTPHRSAARRFKARHLTASEGEFLGLDAGEAERRMRDGRALIEDITGAPATGFIAPAWLYGGGAMTALRACDFAIAEDHFRIWSPRDGRRLATGPVVTWASRSRRRIASSLAVAAVARHALPTQRVVRVAVHPGDVRVPALRRSIDRTVARLVRTHRPARYAELLS